MTWLEFKEKMIGLLTVDGIRLGTLDFIDLQTRAALVDIQSFVPFYRSGHQELYTVSNLTNEGLASRGAIPATADIQDAYLRQGTVQPITIGTTATLDGVTVVASAGVFVEGMKGMEILFASGERGTIATFVSADSVTLEGPAMDPVPGPDSLFSILAIYTSPYVAHDWEDRMSMVHGRMCAGDCYPRIAIDPRGEFYVYPAITGTDQIRLYWDGIKTDFADEEDVTFDLQAAHTAAEWVKGECFRHFNEDVHLWASFNKVGTGSYSVGKRRLWRDKWRAVRLKS